IKFAADGTIWVASNGGLTRFRPNAAPADQWLTYSTANSPMVTHGVRSLGIDSQGNLWIANYSAGATTGAVFKFNPATNQWTRITVFQTLLRPNPWFITVGNNDHIFVSDIGHGGFMEFDGNTWTLRGGDGPQLDSLLQDARGNVWATTGSYGLLKWNGSSWQSWGNLGGTVTTTGLGTDRDGVVYVSCWYGPVYKMVNDQNPVLFANADNIPGPAFGRPNGDVWISNYGGNGTLGTVRLYTAGGQLLDRIETYNSGLPDYFIDRIMRDSGGNMWFASGFGGLSRMQGSNGAPDAPTHWRNFGNHNDSSEPYPWSGNDPMYSLFEDVNGIFWMGGNGVGRWDSNTGQFTGFWNWQNSNISLDGVKAIVKRGNNIWAGMGGFGVLWFDGTTWNHVALSDAGGFDYSAENVKAMAVDTQDNLWVASEYGLRKFAPGNNSTFTLYDSSNTPLPSVSMTDVKADPTGGIWVATFEGLGRFNGAAWTIYNQASTGWPGPLVASVARRASDGLIAVATQQGSTSPYTGGVSTFNGTSWTHYTPQNSPLTHWQVNAVEFDANGNLWASCLSEGVVQIMIGTGAPPLQLASAVSRKTQGAAGTFDIDLPLNGQPGVECRNTGGQNTLVFTFSNNITSGNASVTSGTGAIVGSPAVVDNKLTVNLTGVANAQTITVTLNNVTDTFGQVLPATTVSVGFLVGDTNGDRTVNAGDALQTRNRSGQATDATNFRSDVNADGFVNSGDSVIVRGRSGSALP
ncbi:MAG: dockerin type I domain-containing protein, partial [Verrucomicrobiota bacterium]|nr:dockerin type I domain-containing protein [Verrucomicrobiota bacterium]